jgi:hypothetical protein
MDIKHDTDTDTLTQLKETSLTSGTHLIHTFEVETVGRRERDFHKMRVFKVAITGEVVNYRDFSGSFGFGFSPNFGPFWASFSCTWSSSRA